MRAHHDTVYLMEAVVLAAGSGQRMGGHKLTLQYEKKPLVVHAVSAALEYCSRVTLVTGFFADEVRSAIDSQGLSGDPRLTVVHNEHPEDGQLSSTLTGLKAAGSGSDVAIAVGDAPLVSSHHYRFLGEHLGAYEGVRVFVNGVPGHPMLCSAALVSAILSSSGYSSIREILVGRNILDLEESDPSWVTDIDDPTGYMLLMKNCKL